MKKIKVFAIIGLCVGIVLSLTGINSIYESFCYSSGDSMDDTIRFGADYYTESYQAAAKTSKNTSKICNMLRELYPRFGWTVLGFGFTDICFFGCVLGVVDEAGKKKRIKMLTIEKTDKEKELDSLQTEYASISGIEEKNSKKAELQTLQNILMETADEDRKQQLQIQYDKMQEEYALKYLKTDEEDLRLSREIENVRYELESLKDDIDALMK